jgi:hypothetical protein
MIKNDEIIYNFYSNPTEKHEIIDVEEYYFLSDDLHTRSISENKSRLYSLFPKLKSLDSYIRFRIDSLDIYVDNIVICNSWESDQISVRTLIIENITDNIITLLATGYFSIIFSCNALLYLVTNTCANILDSIHLKSVTIKDYDETLEIHDGNKIRCDILHIGTNVDILSYFRPYVLFLNYPIEEIGKHELFYIIKADMVNNLPEQIENVFVEDKFQFYEKEIKYTNTLDGTKFTKGELIENAKLMIRFRKSKSARS